MLHNKDLSTPSNGRQGDAIAHEARAYSRYLLGVEPSSELVDRYRRANLSLFSVEPDPADLALIQFVARHTWTLPLLDAAAGALRPLNLLRRKLVVMTAILETAPEHAGHFAPRSLSPVLLIGSSLLIAVVSAGKILLGLPLYLALAGRR